MAGANQSEIARLELLHAENPRGRVFAHLAEAYRRAGNAARAREVLRRGLADHPDYPSAHVVLGRVYEDLGDLEAASTAFARVLELDPHNMIALRRLAEAAEQAGLADEALGYWTELLTLDPGDEEVAASVQALRERLDASGDAGEPPSDWSEASVDAAASADPVADAAPAMRGTPTANVDPPSGEPDPFQEEVLVDSGFSAADMSDDADPSDAPIEIETWDSFAPESESSVPPSSPDIELAAQIASPEDDGAPAESDDTPVGADGIRADEGAGSGEAGDAPSGDASFGLIDLGSTSLDLPAPTPGEAPHPDPEETPVESLELENAWPDLGAGEPAAADELGYELDDPDAFGGLETETLGDLYAAQGLHGRAATVYRRLLARSPGDPRLQAKLAEAEARIAEGLEEPVRPEWEDVADPVASDQTPSPVLPSVPHDRSDSADVPEADADRSASRPASAVDGSPSTPDALEPPERPDVQHEGALAEDMSVPLAVPESVDPDGGEAPETFVEPFSFGVSEDVALGADWTEPGGAAGRTGPADDATAAPESDRLWTGEEFGGVFPIAGPDATEDGAPEPSAVGAAWSLGGAPGFGGSPAFFGPSGRIPEGGDGSVPASTAGGTETALDTEAALDTAAAEMPEEIEVTQDLAAAEHDPAAELSSELARALPASAPDTDIREALGEILAWKPGGEAPAKGERASRGVEGAVGAAMDAQPKTAASPERPERPERAERPERTDRLERAERPERPERPERAERPERSDRPVRAEGPERSDRPQPWEPEGSMPPAPETPTGTASATERNGEADTAPPPPPVRPSIPIDLEAEPWAASPVSDGPAPDRPILELGVDDLVRAPEDPTDSGDAAAPWAGPSASEQHAAESSEGDLGDLARSLLDQSVDRGVGGEDDDGADDEELEVFRSWLRSLKK